MGDGHEPDYELQDYEIDLEAPEDDCWNCGGEGFVSDCFEEFACVDPDSGCDLCTQRCDVCNPRPPAKPSQEEGKL